MNVGARIHDDLRGLIEGELLFSPIERAPYALDASLYEIDPLGAVLPRHEADLIALLRYAADQAIPIHPRGAGTSMAGETLGEGLVVDFSRHFRRVIEVKGDRVTVPAGGRAQRAQRPTRPARPQDRAGPERPRVSDDRRHDRGRRGGRRSLRFGTMAGTVESLRVLFSNGETATLGPEPWPHSDEEGEGNFKAALVRKLGTLYRHHGESFAKAQPKSPRNRAGYAFDRAASPEGVNLARLIVGSEGTLALVTEATLHTVPIPSAQGVVVLPFARLADAADAVAATLPFGPSACELFDWRSLSLARGRGPRLSGLAPGGGGSGLDRPVRRRRRRPRPRSGQRAPPQAPTVPRAGLGTVPTSPGGRIASRSSN